MTIQGELLAMLEAVAAALGDDLCNQMVFVGGCSTAVLVTDEITLQEVRATDDVDLIVRLSGVGQWMHLEERLREKGFTVSSEDKVMCRMRLGDLKVDFMPDDPDILGFTNRWYEKGIQTSIKYELPVGGKSSTLQRRSSLPPNSRPITAEETPIRSAVTILKISSFLWTVAKSFSKN